jgi:hypothetical protein
MVFFLPLMPPRMIYVRLVLTRLRSGVTIECVCCDIRSGAVRNVVGIFAARSPAA